MARLIIGLTGEAGSGKGTVASYLKEKYGASTYRFSTVLREAAHTFAIPETRENLIRISIVMREAFGENLLAKALAAASAKDTNDLIVIDGIRRMMDVEELSRLPGFHLVYLTADIKIRYDRLKARGENDGETQMTYEQFLAEEQLPTETSIKEVAREAQTTITNDGPREELFAAFDTLIARLSSTA